MTKREKMLQEKAFFDNVALRFDYKKLERWFLDRFQWYLWDEVLGVLGALKGKIILDLGCGLGFDSLYLSHKGAHVVGLDISKEAIKKAKLFCGNNLAVSNCEFVIGSVESIPFKDEGFDHAFGRAILHHVDVDVGLSEVKRVIRKKCLFVEPLALNPIVNVNRYLLDKYDRSPHEKPLILPEVIKCFKERFRKIWHKEHYFLSPIAYIFRKLIKCQLLYQYTHYVLSKLDDAILGFFERSREYCWITIITGDK